MNDSQYKNDPQNNTHTTKDWETWTSQKKNKKTRVNSGASKSFF